MKSFNTMQGIGKVKYVVNHHDGVSTHKDGSPFFAIACFSNKKKMATFIKGIEAQGYIEK
nr:hypothetical protein [Vibrio splendidus]MCC4883011.1 hypothetical protein [Vibrio splendidus]